MAILVTGAGGMIGRALCRRLAETGETVVGLDKALPAELAESLSGCVLEETATNDIDRVVGLIGEHGVTRIAHCGAISGPMVANDHPEQVFEANIQGTQSLLEAARHSGAKRVIFLSSIMAYGAYDAEVVDEAAPLRATDPYGASKICGEALVRAYVRTQGVNGTSLRVAMVYGPGRTTACPVRKAIRSGFEGKPLVLPYGRGWPRQYIHVDDVVEAIMRALAADRLPRPAYNVSGGTRLPMEDIGALIAAAVPGAGFVLEGEGHPHDYPIGLLATDAAREDFGFSARIDLADSLRRYAEHLRHHDY